MTRFALALWERWFGDAVRAAEAEALAHRLSPAGRGVDGKTIAVLLATAAGLTFMNYAHSPDAVRPVVLKVVGLAGPGVREAVSETLTAWDNDLLPRLTWWCGVAGVGYVVVPVLLIRLAFRERVRDYGTKVRGVLRGWPVYLVFVAVMVPLVAVFSAEPRFQAQYPFYPVRSPAEVDGRLLRWELIYAAQFVALEFFFRGFVLHGLRPRFGAYAIFVMTVPYCMIHFGKPLPECCASIIAGVALGLMSLKTRSIWLGAALHISVAWGMDFCSLYRRGMLG